MTRNVVRGCCAAGIGTLLLVGVVETQSRFKQRQDAAQKACLAVIGVGGGGASGAAAFFGTPEITLEPVLPSIPAGGARDLTVRGRFPAKTAFAVETDLVQVVKETVAENVYQVSLRAVPTAGPTVIRIVAFAPTGCNSSQEIP